MFEGLELAEDHLRLDLRRKCVSGCGLLWRVWANCFYELFAGSYRISRSRMCSLMGQGLHLNCIELAICCIVLQVFLLLIVLVVLCWNLMGWRVFSILLLGCCFSISIFFSFLSVWI